MQANDDVAKNLQQIKAILLGDGDPTPELVAQLAQETYNTDLLLHLVQNIHKLEFESRKDVVQIFNNLLRRQIGSRFPTVEFYKFPHYIESTTFGISCDAYTNLKETLTRHKAMVAEYLDKNYDRFFSSFTTLILSNNYVTKRQSLKLLGEILLDRANFNVMTRYIANEANLKMMMNMLRDKSKNIQFEAFHVFKVFVANPKKPPQIEGILRSQQG
ncbi:hypothetical protein NUW54_g12503 [Trametes sanguinea]|uniref:Uncharacterized protein n=1 Tax=Trametes sanguinea TaxID=158606 RepID=A0ACC1MX97_9APHY|nr:hypothetical protein NUW54_g12503 [Trametes sanguinea]